MITDDPSTGNKSGVKQKKSGNKSSTDWSWDFIENWNRSKLWVILTIITGSTVINWLICLVMGHKRYRLLLSSLLVTVVLTIFWGIIIQILFILVELITQIVIPDIVSFVSAFILVYLTIEYYANWRKEHNNKKLFRFM